MRSVNKGCTDPGPRPRTGFLYLGFEDTCLFYLINTIFLPWTCYDLSLWGRGCSAPLLSPPSVLPASPLDLPPALQNWPRMCSDFILYSVSLAGIVDSFFWLKDFYPKHPHEDVTPKYITHFLSAPALILLSIFSRKTTYFFTIKSSFLHLIPGLSIQRSAI